ncbi:hypothetical protein CERSUDRAFT_93648 [Gelatoporia subvermispora B]|uniref:F-box domain-containing protein n=1 Tax=Ceriporiopsis subvermispora (strain B) TaxID=914234 RepID=M2RH33_CERS8|nr:hypothetical protein CERSUDRAFT_93648 [Gelatoporia subvermispora B]
MDLDPQSIFESIQANREHEVPVDNLRQIIDFTMRHLAADLRCLASCRNLLSPTVARLPVEILARILWFASSYNSDILHASHVCQHWRKVAIENSLLWSVIETWNIDRTREFLRRSKVSTLNIEIEGCYEKDSCSCASTMEELEPHMHRVRRIDVAIERPAELKKWFDWLTDRSAPQLESLFLTFTQECEGHRRPPFFIHPKMVFQGNLSHLRSLDLDSIVLCLPDPAPTFPHLTYLSISLHNTKKAPPLSKWLEILKHSPQLRDLSIHNRANSVCEELHTLGERNTDLQVNFPVLSELRLVKTPVNVIQAILKHLLLPVTCSMEFDIDNTAWIRHSTYTLDYRDIGGVSLIKTIKISRKNSAALEGYIGGHEGPPLLTVKAEQETLNSTLDSLSQCLNVFNVRVLVARSLDMNDWNKILSQLPQLRELWINNSDDPRDGSLHTAMRTLAIRGVCPMLRRLHVTQASLGTSDLQALRECVEKRSSHGIAGPLEEIELEGVPMWEGGNENDDLVHLRCLCPNVVVVN